MLCWIYFIKGNAYYDNLLLLNNWKFKNITLNFLTLNHYGKSY